MIRPIVKDTMFLSRKSVPAKKGDERDALDLIDTLRSKADICVGMAANMIGIDKRIIAVNLNGLTICMYNPVLSNLKKPYVHEEGCLSLNGTRSVKRYGEVDVTFFDLNWKKRRMHLSGFNAAIVQHECDHLEGILI